MQNVSGAPVRHESMVTAHERYMIRPASLDEASTTSSVHTLYTHANKHDPFHDRHHSSGVLCGGWDHQNHSNQKSEKEKYIFSEISIYRFGRG
jgi:hypothetical protein